MSTAQRGNGTTVETSDPALFDAPAPVVTVHLDARSDQVKADEALALRWRNARRTLEADGADAATLAAIDEAMGTPGAHAGGQSLVVVAAGGEVLVRRALPDPPPDGDEAHVGPLPHLLPLIAADQSAVTHVVVLVDKAGADLYARTGPVGDEADERLGGEGVVERSVEGDTEHIHRSAPGGWSQRRFQQRSENTWERNASEAADAVVSLADEVGAELVVVGGDVRARGFLLDSLPARVAGITRPVEDASRAEGAGTDHVAQDVHRLVRTLAAERLTAVLATWDEERGQGDRAADGPAAVVASLQAAAVETLLVGRGDDDDRRAWVGPSPEHLALERDDLTAGMGVEGPVEASLIDACIRAALGTGAAVVVAPSTTLTEGLGAILRHTGAAPAA